MVHEARWHRIAGAGLRTLALAAVATLLLPGVARGEPITYQGVLTSLGDPVFGPIDVRATLFDAETDGTQIGPTVTANVGTEPNGTFTVQLDFGPDAFGTGQQRWLQLEVANPAGSNDYTLLNPRQPVGAAPLAAGLVGIHIVPGGSEIVDQAQDLLSSFAFSSNQAWQSFTAGLSGTLTGVRLQVIEVNSGSQGNISVQVRAGVGTAGEILGEASLVFDPVPQGEFTRTITVGLPSIPIANGQRYTLVFSGQSFLRIAGATIPGAQGASGGSPTRFWFQTLVMPIARMNVASTLADFATEANRAATAQSAVTAQSAATASTANVALAAPWAGLTGQAEVETGAIGTGWQLLFTNSAQSTFRGGMRLNDSGFFDVTNNANAASPGFARLSSAGTWSAVSDARLKHDVSPLDTADQLQRVLRLKPVAFTWNDSGTRDLGLIAQDVRSVMPEFVQGDEAKDLLTVNYSQLSVAAIAAIQAMEERHQKERSALEAKIEALTERLEALERKP